MKKIITVGFAAFALTAVAANAEMTTKETTTSTSYSGTVSSMTPGSTIVLKTESAPEPQKYVLTEKTTFVDSSGAVVTKEAIQDQPVTIYTEKMGDQVVVSKVVTTKKTTAAPMIEKKTTTTTTTGVE
jgi:hypothetical protein